MVTLASVLTAADGTGTAVAVDPVGDLPEHGLTGGDERAERGGLAPSLINHGRAAGRSIEGILQIGNYSGHGRKDNIAIKHSHLLILHVHNPTK